MTTQFNRRKLLAKVKEYREHSLVSLRKEIDSQRETLRSRLTAWRSNQRAIMPKAGDAVIRQPPCEVECEKLYLPSEFPSSERDALEVAILAGEETKLREGEAFDSLLLIQTAVKTVVALRDQKNRHARGQGENTRSGTLIRGAEAQRDLHMQTYHFARSSMIALGFLDAGDFQPSFPPLTLQDTFMKSHQRKRGLGDSRQTDGVLWHMGGIVSESNAGPSRTPPTTGASGESGVGEVIGVSYLSFLMSSCFA
jgi:hypothetical protein